MKRTEWLWAGALIGGLLFALLALDQVLHGPVYQLDFPVDAWMTRLASQGAPVHAFGNVMSQPGSLRYTAPLLTAAATVLLFWRRWDLTIWCLVAGIGIGFLNTALKATFQRALPPFIVHRFPHGYAFPSGHTMGAAGTLGVCILLLAEGHVWRKGLTGRPAHRTRVAAVTAWGLVALIVGVGRVLAQNHWVSDVLSGWAISGALVCATLLLVERFATKPPPAPATL